MRYFRIFATVVISLAALGIAGSFFVDWSTRRAFESALKEVDGPQQLENGLKAVLGATLARGDSIKVGTTTGEGAIAYYRRNPQALDSDMKFFETWQAALAITHARPKTDRQLRRWESSADADWISSPQSVDAWGHTFCFRAGQQQTIVVSPGPGAQSSLNCDTLKISEEVLTQMPQGRLNVHPPGVLILFVKRS